jgi:hypothetical protein
MGNQIMGEESKDWEHLAPGGRECPGAYNWSETGRRASSSVGNTQAPARMYNKRTGEVRSLCPNTRESDGMCILHYSGPVDGKTCAPCPFQKNFRPSVER